MLLKYAYGWEKLELVVYVTLRKCSRACIFAEYFYVTLGYAYVGGKLVLSPQGRVLDHVHICCLSIWMGKIGIGCICHLKEVF